MRDELGGPQAQGDAVQYLGFNLRADVVAAADVGQAQDGDGWSCELGYRERRGRKEINLNK